MEYTATYRGPGDSRDVGKANIEMAMLPFVKDES